jgi:hypothetical protein
MKRDSPVIVHLTTLIEAGARARAWISPNPPLTAAMLFSALHGAVDDEIVAPTSGNRRRLVAAVSAFCRRALGLGWEPT